jgi:hypothetical protein
MVRRGRYHAAAVVAMIFEHRLFFDFSLFAYAFGGPAGARKRGDSGVETVWAWRLAKSL